MFINKYWFGLYRRSILKYVIVSYRYKNVLERKMYFEITHKKSASTFALIFHLKEAPGTDLEKAVRWKGEKQPPKGVLKKRCSENMQQIYRRKPMRSMISIKLLCDFIEITLRHVFSPVNLLHIFRTPFRRNTSGCLLLKGLFMW